MTESKANQYPDGAAQGGQPAVDRDATAGRIPHILKRTPRTSREENQKKQLQQLNAHNTVINNIAAGLSLNSKPGQTAGEAEMNRLEKAEKLLRGIVSEPSGDLDTDPKSHVQNPGGGEVARDLFDFPTTTTPRLYAPEVVELVFGAAKDTSTKSESEVIKSGWVVFDLGDGASLTIDEAKTYDNRENPGHGYDL